MTNQRGIKNDNIYFVYGGVDTVKGSPYSWIG